MKKSNRRPKIGQKRGITLIALVITIIVLLILAGVSLSLIAGSDGILTKATNAAPATDFAINGTTCAVFKNEQRVMELFLNNEINAYSILEVYQNSR